MRIITGCARGVKLLTREGELTRPTAERTKEAIFSKLQFDIEGRRILDLFAGSGQLGLEALSRGAAHAVLCDREREAVAVITKNAEKTRLREHCTILCSDFAACLERQAQEGKKFDIVFLDPPYASSLLTEALAGLCRLSLLSPHATVVCESGAELSAIPESLSVAKQMKYGVAHVTFLTPREEGEI